MTLIFYSLNLKITNETSTTQEDVFSCQYKCRNFKTYFPIYSNLKINKKMFIHVLRYLLQICCYFRQLFIVYDALAEPSLKRINNIVGTAVNMCTLCYLLVCTVWTTLFMSYTVAFSLLYFQVFWMITTDYKNI